MTMAAITYNRKKLIRWKSKKLHTDIKGLRYSLQALIFILADTTAAPR